MTFLRMLLRRPPPTETLRANAERFVAVVQEMAREQRYIQMFPHVGYHGRKTAAHGWIAMPNLHWRCLVQKLLIEGGMVTDAQFHEPDSLDGWTFSAVSIFPTPRVALLNLEDKI